MRAERGSVCRCHGRADPRSTFGASPTRRSEVPDNRTGLLQEFKAFVLRDNVLDLAVAFVIATAFKDVVTALVADIIMPIVSIPGSTTFGDLHFRVRHSVFAYGAF